MTSGGTIPDRGLFGVFLVGEKAIAGSASSTRRWSTSRGSATSSPSARRSWRIEDITHDRVLVSPAPGPARPAAVLEGRPARPARRARRGDRRVHPRARRARRRGRRAARCRDAGLDEWAADNLVAFLAEQREATGHAARPTAPSLVERFRDELGDWRLVVHSPYGAQVHAPWALAIGARLRERYGIDAQALPADDGIVLRIPETDQPTRPAPTSCSFDPDEIEDIVTAEVGGSALFASRFRECAARALLLPRRDPGRRSPLWQQRQRSAQLLEVAAKYPSFPIVLETVRECLQDVYDVPALVGLMRDLARAPGEGRRGRDRSSRRRSPGRCCSATSRRSSTRATPARRAPRRRARRSTRGCSPSCSAAPSCASCSTPTCSPSSRPSCSGSTPDRRARDAEGVADLLRLLGPLTHRRGRRRASPARRRGRRLARAARRRPAGRRGPGRRRGAVGGHRGRRPAPRRARRAAPAGHARGVHRAGRRPARRPGRPLRPHPRPVHRRRRRRAGSGSASPSRSRRCSRLGRARAGCSRASSGRPAAGTRVVRRRGAAPAAAPLARRAAQGGRAGRAGDARPLPARPGSTSGGSACAASTACSRVVEQLAGAPCRPARSSRWCCRRRVADYAPGMLDELTATGEVLWAGHGTLPGTDGWVSLHLADSAHLTLPDHGELDAHAAARRGPRGARAAAAPTSSGSSPTPSGPPTTRRSSRRCGTWSGRAGSATTPSPRCARSPPAAAPRTAHAGRRPRAGASARRRAARAADPHRPADRCRPLVAAARPRGRRRPAARTPPPRRCSSATAWSPAARSSASACRAGSPGSTRCSPPSRTPAAAAAATSSTALGAAQFGGAGRRRPAAVVLRASAPATAADPSGQAARPSSLAATDPANPYGAALPWPERGSTTRRRRPGTARAARPARSWCSSTAAGLRRARRPDAAHLHRRRRRAHSRRRTRSPPPYARGARPAHRRAGRRRAHPRPAATAAAPGARGGRLRRRPRAGCGCVPRDDAVPEGDTVWRTARHLDQALSRPGADRDRLPGARPAPPSTCPGSVVERRSRAASTCSPGSATSTRCTPT